ncbi:hypothetical protein ANN_17270 [Periplaneta americana]|uniref:DDE-1 domain-containing protein n=1 Tax=Periplaneta americana TaxID=6978 RepID=A0ABQ8STS6_PERAM|nr:hypothetical protein ANN_17270 [Periplaneta americana]
MPHKYKRKEGVKPRGPIDSDVMKNAVAAVKAGGTYKAFKVPLMTLKRLCRKLGEDNTNISYTPDYKKITSFTKEEEEELTEYLLMASRLYYGLTNNNTKTLTYEYAKMNRKNYPKNWDRNEAAGSDWLRDLWKEILYYESGFTIVHKPRKIIAEKGVKQVGKVTFGERGSLVTICVAVNASGNHIPPFLIFPKMNWQDRMLHGAPPETSGCTHPSGWMRAASFLLFLKHFVKHTKCSVEDKQLLIMDNHDSHISVDAVNYAKKNDRPNPVKEPLLPVENSVASSSEISGQTTSTKLPKAKEHFTPEQIRPFPKAPPRIAQSARGRKHGSKELEKIILHDSSDDNNFYESSSSPEDSEPSGKLKVNDFVIVRFSTKKTIKHFVGKIEKIIWPDSEVEVYFLKKKEGSYQFYFPEQIDKSLVNVEDCVTKLPQPSILLGTLRLQD